MSVARESAEDSGGWDLFQITLMPEAHPGRHDGSSGWVRIWNRPHVFGNVLFDFRLCTNHNLDFNLSNDSKHVLKLVLLSSVPEFLAEIGNVVVVDLSRFYVKLFVKIKFSKNHC